MAANNKPRRAAHLEMIGGKSKRQRVWEAIRKMRDDFTLTKIALRVDVEATTVQTYVLALTKGGYVEPINAAGIYQEKHLRLAKDAGLEAPRLTRDGKPVVQGLAQEQMWRTMRILGADFNAAELAGLASTVEITVSTAAAQDYLKHLGRAGYVTVAAKGKGHGKGGTLSRFRFVQARYTGPRPPMIQRTKSVYDPNLAKVVWQEEVNDDDL